MKRARAQRGTPWNWLCQATGVFFVRSRGAGHRGLAVLGRRGRLSSRARGTGGVGLAMRDGGQTQLEREAARLAALLESARAQSRAGGIPVRWRALPGGFRFEGLPRSAQAALPNQWLDPGTVVRGPAVLLLGPEPLIGPQQVLITHQSSPVRTLRIATDGVRPFSVDAVQ